MQKSAMLIHWSVQTAKYSNTERSLLMQKNLLVSKQITYTHMQARSIVSFSFQKSKVTCNMVSKGHINLKGKTQTKARLRKQKHACKNKPLM